jgi:hypothetical protein
MPYRARLICAFVLAAAVAAPIPQTPATENGVRGATAPVPEQRFDGHWCGTGANRFDEELLRHELNKERIEREGIRAAKNTLNTDMGDLAVIEDDNTIVVSPNTFDIVNKNVILFTPVPGEGYRIERNGAQFVKDVGMKQSGFQGSGLGNPEENGSKEVVFPSGFTFPFYGKTYDRMYVAVDGFISFESTALSLFGNITPLAHRNGVPRIAPFWADLDTSGLPAKSGIFVRQSADSVIVTWKKVPNDDTTFKNVVQVQLFPDGRIAFVYKKVVGRADLVGLSPGDRLAELERVDFRNPPNQPAAGALFEHFATFSEVDIFQLGKVFYETHGDDYDFLYLWANFGVDLGGAFAYYLGVRNDTRGIGLGTFNRTASFGSAGRLQGFINMNSIFVYPQNPETQFLGMNNTYSILGQEQGHRWLAFVNFRDGNNVSNEILGRSDAHWSPYFNTESTISSSNARNSSSVEGNSINDTGGGNFVTNQHAINYFSELDQYLMGVRAASEVSEMFLVKNGTGSSGTDPATGLRLRGNRKRVTIDDIIAAEGQRVPDVTTAQKEWRAAWILLVENGTQPAASTVQRMQSLQGGWEEYFNRALEGRGTLSTALVQ